MDIYSAEIQVKKLLEYVTSLSESSSRMYNKTRVRLTDLAAMCEKVVAVISQILQRGALESCDDSDSEFSQPDDANVAEAIVRMQEQLNQLQTFLVPEVKQVAPITEASLLKKQAYVDYKLILHDASLLTSNYPITFEITALIWRWFYARFVDPKNIVNFKYNMRRIPDWIRDIVILYCYAVETHTEIDFVNEFSNWCSALSTDKASKNYAVPYSIYLFDKDPDPTKLTLTAVAVWDILIDNQFGQLSQTVHDSDLYLNPYAIYDMCGKLTPQLLDRYKHYSIDTEFNVRFKASEVEG